AAHLTARVRSRKAALSADDPVRWLVCEGRPPTANKKLRADGEDFLARLRGAATKAGWSAREDLLQGTLCWFVRGYDLGRDSDADNLSKRVWDALEGLAFADDKQVRLRTAAIIDLGPVDDEGEVPDIEALDLTDVPDDLAMALDRLLSGRTRPGSARSPSFTYIELAPLDLRQLTFRGAARGRQGRRD
ncbi:MAG: RusA family crossover junction endodeoxyribonuclease, partial [Acetobacteraceae bacterium]|nr:RusA family crossover junction endodeoxyribonuclease [Acetobacteraceae bacterium]